MLPILKVPDVIHEKFKKYKHLFPKKSQFRNVGYYITNLLINTNKTLQGAYYSIIFLGGERFTRRAMHESVFNSNWTEAQLMPEHRKIIRHEHQGQFGMEVISLDWTVLHHDKGPCIYGNKMSYDYVKGRYSRIQTALTATIINKKYIDGINIDLQDPSYLQEELEYLNTTCQENYDSQKDALKRFVELLYYQKHQKSYKKKSEIFLEQVNTIEHEGNFPKTNYAFDNGVLSVKLTRFIEEQDKHWVSELEVNRHINWQGKWIRIDEVSKMLREKHPGSYKELSFQCRNGEYKTVRAFSKVVKLKRGYGKKRIAIIHESQDLSDKPRFLITDAKHWKANKMIKTWNYRWPCEIFHEFAKQDAGLESAQVRKEKSVKRHLQLSCVAQSVLQRVDAPVAKCEKFEFAKGKETIGQQTMVIVRDVFKQSIQFAEKLFKEGKTADEIVAILMPT